jgi:hypothetical protein
MKVVKAHEVKRLIMSYSLFERNHIAAVTEGLNNADVLSITEEKLAVEYEIKVSKSDLDKELAAIRYATMTMKEGKNLGPVTLGPKQEQLNLELAGLKKKAGGWSKISKHEEYIDPKKYFEEHRLSTFWNYRYVPNYFYLVVPRGLVAYAIEQTKGTGYGVIAFDGCRQEGQHYGNFKDGKWYERWGDHPDDTVWKFGAPCSDNCIFEVAVKQKAKRLYKEPVNDRILMGITKRACAENVRMLGELVRLGADVLTEEVQV